MKFENIYKETEENMRLALLSLWTPGAHPMRPAIEELLDREPLLAEPVFQSTFGWEPTDDETWRGAINTDVWDRLENMRKSKAEDAGKEFRPFVPFRHQADSWKTLAEGKSIVVTSGTGSGKTECFMYPVLSDLYEQGRTNAIEAIFLYPLNALMEDQKKRLSEYCQATGLHFAVYNGDTPEFHENGSDLLPNEIGSREKIRDSETRPEILLTNPSMLEYILVRMKDQQMLHESEKKLRWIIIDEAHSYSGSAAVELAYQIKRILDAFGVRADEVRFACTSATIGGEEGAQSLAGFISTLTGQSVENIKVIGGKRLVRPLDENALSDELERNNLPAVERVISLRDKINQVAGMTLQQMWEWLCPDITFGSETVLPALQLLDKLCEMSQGNIPVLSLRGHFFMRAINGLYACANEKCTGVNPAISLYGHLTTYKASVCTECGAPLLEIVQCKYCGGFVLMGCSDSQTHKISPCEDIADSEDFFSIDLTPEQEEEDELISAGHPDKFFLLPYEKDRFFNPVSEAGFSTISIIHEAKSSRLEVDVNNDGRWVEVRKNDGHSYCPDCGRLAQGKRLNLKHFRMPINFINQTISPVFLQECAPAGSGLGKYIAFTDSRQGTAISAKTFNINVERNQSYKNILNRLSRNSLDAIPENLRNILTEEQIKKYLASSPEGVSLYDFSESIYNETLFRHLTSSDNDNNIGAYKAALIRNIIGRRPLYETNVETLGFIYLDYPSLKTAKVPDILSDYAERNHINITDKDWQDYLKICIDYVLRMGNHIQPLIENERRYVRDSNLSTPISAPDDVRDGVKHWSAVNVNNGNVSDKQSRLVLLLCAGLGIHSLEKLRENVNIVNAIIKDAWNVLVDKKILTKVSADDRDGYNNPTFYPNGQYVGCYYLDLSGRDGNNVCRIKRLEKGWMCPVTNKILDTTFCGYSPSIVGRMCSKLFERYHCSDVAVTMPCRPQDNNEVVGWLKSDDNVKNLKKLGIWTDRHKYSYRSTPVYIAAEHSAQQSKELLREYTRLFSQNNPEINVLHCSTTMEMGVDIGDIDLVLMDTVPPTAANYLQRVGRAGRMGQSKAVAFSLCNNTPVGQNAFANPMWALQTINHMIKVRPSQTIIQRHINSFFFRKFICRNGTGIQANISIDEFMYSECDAFVQFLDEMSTNQDVERKFKDVFGDNVPYTINVTKQSIIDIQNEYNDIINELTDAFKQYEKDQRRQMAISNQIRKSKSENLLSYLSEHQFIPNANMPIGVVTFDFKDRAQSRRLYELYGNVENIQNKISAETDPVGKFELQQNLIKLRKDISALQRATTASRDVHTALNEYAPEQTVVVNEKNYVSAGVSFFGAYNNETQTRAIYHCKSCGHTEYRTSLNENLQCPVCGNPYHGIIDKDHSSYTLAYEPVGFCTDQNRDGTREEKTEKNYYEIRPVLLKTDWNRHTDINMCEVTSSGESGNILFYNVGKGYGFAFCKRCGRAAIEYSRVTSNDNVPNAVKPGHKRLFGDNCEANHGDIARHVVFTGNHPTCYSVLRFKKNAGSAEFENDEQLVYSLGVVLKRALAQSEGIDESEIDFGIKQEIDSWVLFVYDTAKGGCGYSLRFTNPASCQEIFDLARHTIEETNCNCHQEGGACAQCLIDRNNYRYANLLSKAKVLDWLNRQKNGVFEVTDKVRSVSPFAKTVFQSLKNVVRTAINDSSVTKISLFVSDLSDDYAITDWSSIRSEMGKCISDAVIKGKNVQLFVEYHPELHKSLTGKLPFINLKDKFPDCKVAFIEDMGPVKIAVIVETEGKRFRYFTDEKFALSFSNNWGKDCNHIFVDEQDAFVSEQKEPKYEISSSEVIREGITKATSFQIKNYFTSAIAPDVLKPEDIDMLSEVLGGKHVNITFSDMYVNSALASLMLVYLIYEMRNLFGFQIDNIMLQLDSPKRKCNNERFSDWSPISMNFECKEDADDYTDSLFQKVLDIDPEHSFTDADHHRWLKIETLDGCQVEIRPDHGISGGYRSDSKYMNIDSLNGSVRVFRNNEDVLYYVIIKK